MTDVLAAVRAHLTDHFTRAGVLAEPDEASVTFLGTEPSSRDDTRKIQHERLCQSNDGLTDKNQRKTFVF